MPTTLTIKAEEESTYTIQVSFKDEDGNSVVPNSIYWKLTDSDGTTLNSRNYESVAVASVVNITLEGDDLSVVASRGSNKKRVLTVWGKYDSDLGYDLAYADSCKFFVKDLVAIS